MNAYSKYVSEFGRVSDCEWKLSSNMDKSRRELLYASGCYEVLLEKLLEEATVVAVKRERARQLRIYRRVVLTLRVEPGVLDLFYNSPSGYRAQYYLSTELGARANRYAIDKLVAVLLVKAGHIKKRGLNWEWAKQSLMDSDAKLWPHQGLWLHWARLKDRNLFVDRWINTKSENEKERRKGAIWSTLTPNEESLLEFKGGFILSGGESLGTFKPNRALNIHELGYT